MPQPPELLIQTLEQLKERDVNDFEPHYLPMITLHNEDNFPGWQLKPQDWFWQQIENGKVNSNAATLRPGWYLVDGRGRPQYRDGKQLYKGDPLGNLMKGLRETGEVRTYKYVPQNSRFGPPYDNIALVILPAFIKKYEIKPPVRILRAIEFNVLGNMAHSDWGQNNTYEWFSDRFAFSHRLLGGCSEDGGLTNVYFNLSSEYSDNIGFRPMIVFPETTSPELKLGH